MVIDEADQSHQRTGRQELGIEQRLTGQRITGCKHAGEPDDHDGHAAASRRGKLVGAAVVGHIEQLPVQRVEPNQCSDQHSENRRARHDHDVPHPADSVR
ncbi:MAG: hypothetical protein U5R48_13570 [Gammaproteobacteria bacterium]|nr:hypothetical protein [Gammaproteobacteria bacterium]